MAFITTLKEHDHHAIPKLALRAITLLFTIIAIALLAATIASNHVTDFSAGGFAGGAIGVLGCCFIWTVVYILLQLIRKKPPHPGVAVALDLLLWMALAVMAGFVITEGVYVRIDPESYGGYYYSCESGYDGGYSGGYGYSGYDGSDCDPSALDSTRHWAAVELAGGAFVALIALLELTLFIWACVDCARHNRSKVSRQAEEIAQKIVQNIVETRGLQAQGQAPPGVPAGAANGQHAQPESSRDEKIQPAEEGSAHGYYAPQAPHAV